MKRIFDRIEKLLEKEERVFVSIDGPCASGKTTLGKKLAEAFDGNLIHVDDFFLRSEQRTPERLSEVGGNFDRERFWEEVMNPMIRSEEFYYRPYVCSQGSFGESVFVPRKRLYIIEGSYSQHPFLGKSAYQLFVFLKIDSEIQKRRLAERDPQKLDRFLSEWIPKEQAYFEKFRIRENADLCIEL